MIEIDVREKLEDKLKCAIFADTETAMLLLQLEGPEVRWTLFYRPPANF
jgi:hypothetical protein